MFETSSITVDLPSDLEDLPPGSELGAVLAALDWESLTGHELIRALRAQERQIAHYQAGRAWTMDRITEIYEDASRGWAIADETTRAAAAEIAAALRLTRATSEDQVRLSIALCRHRRQVFEALLFGRIDLHRAKILIGATLLLRDADAFHVLDQILPEARQLTTGQLRHRLQKLCIDADPDAAKKRYEDSHAERRLVLEATNAGTASLSGHDLDPEDAVEIKRWINREALRLKRHGDKRTMDQLRADIYIDLLQMRHTTTHHQHRNNDGGVHIDVTLDTLTKLSEESGDIHGYGTVTADIARQIAEHQVDSKWTWALRDYETGRPIDGGITRRRPTTAQRRYAQAHNRTCVHPGCRMPAVDCDIDHRIPWNERRVTCTADLAPLCRHHHVIRHTWGWSYRPLPNGDWLFTTPLRHHHTTSGTPPPLARSP